MTILRPIQVPAWLERLAAPLALLWRRLRYGYAFRRIPLTQGLYALVDSEDYESLARHKWHATRGRTTFYAQRKVWDPVTRREITIKMHRQILHVHDGLLVDHLSRIDRNAVEEETSVRQTSVLQLGRRSDFDEDHARTVAKLGLELFDTAREMGLHGQGPRERELFFYAALLHDVGRYLSYSNHHANSAWFIRYADLLGFSQDELTIMAATAYFHRKELPGDRLPEFLSLDEAGRNTVRGQFFFLRMAESLDRSHAALVESARFLSGKRGGFVLEVCSSRDCQLELSGIGKHRGTFERFYGRELNVSHVFKEGSEETLTG